MKIVFTFGLIGLMCLAAPLAGCAQVAAGLSSVAGKIAGPVTDQARTYGDAVLLADAATRATSFAVDTVKLPRATLVQLSAGSDGVHAAFLQLKAANDSGGSLDFAAFNAAIAAFNAYAVANGVAKATTAPPS